MPIRVFYFACGVGSCSGCRILCGYPTTTCRILSRLSDSLRLSDNHAPDLVSVVGFSAVIRQPRAGSCLGCRILCGYPTTTCRILSRLSDSLRLSDNHVPDLVSVVGFFAVIRQLHQEACPGCRILRGYPTTAPGYLPWLSDSAWLSDNPKYFLVFSNFHCILQELFPTSQTVLQTVPTSRANVRKNRRIHVHFVQSF
jgi:hypothetical protein